MDWKKFAKGEVTQSNDLKDIDSVEQEKVSFRDIREYDKKKKEGKTPVNRISKKMEQQGFNNPSQVSQHAYEKLKISSTLDKFSNNLGFFTTLDVMKQTTFNYYNNQIQHNMLHAAQNDELIKQNDKIIEQNDEIINLLSQIANK